MLAAVSSKSTLFLSKSVFPNLFRLAAP